MIATAQLMLVLDDSIANIALPTIQNELGVASANLPWVINAYILAFGGLLLFGGRVGDLFGRRRVLQLGMAIFTVASLLAGLATSGLMLIAARGLQGIGAALTAPSALALIATTFPEGKPRNKAMAVYGAMSGVGIVAGLLLGGLLTGTLGWRAVFFINIPIGLLVLVGARTLVEAELHRGRLDVAGALSSIGGMVALVHGVTRGGEHGWGDSLTIASFAVAAVLLPVFVFGQSRSRSPLVPLSLFRDRSRAGSYLAMLLLAFGPMGAFYLLTLYMQHVLAFSPIRTGLSWLPFGFGIMLGAGITTKLVTKVAPRGVAAAGMVLCSAAVFWLSTLGHDPSYAAHILPAIFLTAFGFAMGFVPLTLTAVEGVRAQESGIASALLNASQQIGVALGLALLSTVAVTATDARLPRALDALYAGREAGDPVLIQAASDALIRGYGSGLAVGAVAIAVAALLAAVLITARRPTGDVRPGV
ncbi:MFS transporter [Sorangium sp. So ce1182]|uniref:MFS transporter n=1 Tax=Sorangium sp. So ce1182 TaxID=3133334 RepID=UPI003F5F4DAF